MIATPTNFIPLTGNAGNPTTGPVLLGDLQNLQLDTSGSATINGDGSGNINISGVSWSQVSTPFGASSGTVIANVVSALFNNSGTAADTVLAVRPASGTHTGSGLHKLIDLQNSIGVSQAYFDSVGTLHCRGAVSTSFTAAQLIFVDGTNGNDTTGIGTALSPYKTVTKAISVATAGMAVFVGPGTYVLAGANSGMTPASGVAIIGAGRGVTIVQNHTDYNGVYRPASNCLLKDITLDTADPTGTHNGITVQLAPGNTPGNVVFDNVDFICSYDGVNPGGNGAGGGGTGPFNWYFRNCHFHGTCWMYYDQVGISALFLNCDWVGDGTIPRLDGLAQYGAIAGVAASSRAIVVGGNISFVDASTNANLWANAAVVAAGAQILFSGTNISIICPNAPSTAMVAPFAYMSSLGGGGSFQVGDGVTFSAYSFFGNSNFAMPTVQYLNATQPLAVSGSAVTPYFSRNRLVFTIAADAGTLASNTLTVNAPSNSAGDGNRFGLRIKNTNSASTSMTISLNSAYNLGAASIGTIAPAKRLYLEFCFDADNSKWDLVTTIGGL
jgi:hypothetical protein